jgi:PKD repeat protein
MKYLSVWIIGILIFSGCLDFLDEDNENGAPVAVIKIEGDSPFEPDTDIIFSGKGSNDPDNDILEYYWDFDNSDGNDENKIGSISEFGKIIHYYSIEKTYTVTLTVSDGDKTASTTVNIKIERSSSDIRAIVNTDDETESVMDGEEQITYTFSAAESESESDIIKYEWDFSYESSDGFTVDEESSEPEINKKFDSGLYMVKVRITNEVGESDESSYSDDVDLKINFDYETTRTIDSGQQEHIVQLYGLPARYIRATLEYESNSVHTKDLDLYLYNTTQDRNPDDSDDEHVDSNTTHNNDDIEQINIIELDYYNNTDRSWFDESHELGDWTIVVDHERTGSSEYTLRIEVIYWE